MEIRLAGADLGGDNSDVNTPRAYMTTTNTTATSTVVNTPIKIANTTSLDPDPDVTNLISMPLSNRLQNDSGADFRAVVSIDAGVTKGSGSGAQNLILYIYLDGVKVQEGTPMHASSTTFVQQAGLTRQFVWPAGSFIEVFVETLTDSDTTVFEIANVTVTYDGGV